MQAFRIHNQTLLLLPEKAIFWEEQRWLLIADVHLGKASHFRKKGMPVPRAVGISTAERLEQLVRHWSPAAVVFLGDLFHSRMNNEWKFLVEIIERYRMTRFILVEGNHDILDLGHYSSAGLETFQLLENAPFCFSHEPVTHDLYNICGHIHPGVRVFGKARQSLSVPCFHFGANTGILPAFGDFTGRYEMQVRPGEKVFACAPGSVVELRS